jgi:hypothetical protein
MTGRKALQPLSHKRTADTGAKASEGTGPKVRRDFNVLEFTVEFGGRNIEACITHQALQDHFGANDDPTTWVRAYQSHRVRIHRAVQQLVLDGVQEPVTVWSSRF